MAKKKNTPGVIVASITLEMGQRACQVIYDDMVAAKADYKAFCAAQKKYWAVDAGGLFFEFVGIVTMTVNICDVQSIAVVEAARVHAAQVLTQAAQQPG